MPHSRSSLYCILMFFLKKYIINYKSTMLAQYLVLLWAANAQKSKKRSDKAFDSHQAHKERKFYVHMLLESLYVVVPI